MIAGFIVDFYCAAVSLAVELDGSQHYSDQGLAYDKERSDVLKMYGISVLRFSNTDIDDNFEAVCNIIDSEVCNRLVDDEFDI